MDLTIRPATLADVQLLAEMNRQLCDDERSRNNMTVAPDNVTEITAIEEDEGRFMA